MANLTIKIARVIKGYKQEDLASVVGTSKQNIHNWEAKKTKPSIEMAFKLAKALDVDINELEYFFCS